MSPPLAAVYVLCLVSNVPAAPAGCDWPCWRGASGDGVSQETGWKLSGPTLWTREVGLGHSESSIAGDRLFTRGFLTDREEDVLWCLDADRGDVIWTHAYPATRLARGHTGGTLTTPAVAGSRVVASDRTGSVRALDAATGEVLWLRDLRQEHGVEPTDYGFAGSPLCRDGRVYVNARRTFCLDLESGETVWQSEDHVAMYSTPAPFALADEPLLATFTKEGLWILDVASGTDRFHLPWQKGETRVNAGTPVVIGERIFISSAYDHGCALVAFPPGGPEVVFANKRMRSKLSSCAYHAGHIYGFDESVLKCLDLAGEERWRKRGLGLGSLRVAGDRLLLLTERGELVTARATPQGYEELAREPLFDEGAVYWSAPVLSAGRLYLRSGTGRLVCQDRRSD